MTNEERKEFYMNRNIKLSPSIIALTWDVIFVWTVSNLYFTTVKGLSNSQVISLDSVLMLLGCFMCVPVGKLFQNVRPIVATRISLFGYAGYLLLSIFGNSYPVFMFAQVFLAFGYAVNAVKTNSVLTDSLAVVKRDKDYQRIYGKGMSMMYIIECVGAIVMAYVFEWNPHMVYIFSLLVVVLVFVISLFYKDPIKFQEKNVDIQSKVVTDEKQVKPDSFKKILKSGFIISLLVFAFLFRGVISITGSAFKIYLNSLVAQGSIPMWSYGYIYAISRLTNVLSSKYQFKFNLKFGVRSLLIFVFLTLITFVLSGVTYLINSTSIISIIIIIAVCCVSCSIRTPCMIFLNNYLQVCSAKKNVERLYSIRIMVEYLGYAAISSIYALILAGFNDNFGLTNLVYVGIFAVPLIISLFVFIRMLCKKHAQKFTIIKPEYTED